MGTLLQGLDSPTGGICRTTMLESLARVEQLETIL